MSFQNAQIRAVAANPIEYLNRTAQRGMTDFVISSGSLRAFATCPSRWLHGYEPPDSEAKEYGRLLDCLHLTPEQFHLRYAIEPENYEDNGMECPHCHSVTDSKKCAKCKADRVPVAVSKPWRYGAAVTDAWKQEQLAAQKEIISRKDLAAVQTAVKRLGEDETIAAFAAASDRQVWLAAEWHDEATKLIIPCKCLIDYAPRLGTEFEKCLGDLKTTRNAALMPWQRWCFSAGYHVQAAFDIDMWMAARPDEDRNTWCFVVQENFEPWETAKRMLSQDFLTLGRETYRKILSNYCQCLHSRRWPTYDDHDEAVQGWSLVQPEPFMADRELFAPQYRFTDEEAFAEETPQEPIDVPN